MESAIRRGNHINTACALAGVSTAAFYRWMQRADAVDYAITHGRPHEPTEVRFREFRDAILSARAEAAETMVDVVHQAAVGGQLIAEEPALDGAGNPIRDADGQVIMKRQWTQPDGRLALAYLKVAQPGEWGGGPQRVEVTGPGGLPLAPGAAPGGDDTDGEGVSNDQVGRLAARLREAVAAREREAIEARAHETPDDGTVYEGEIVEDDG